MKKYCPVSTWNGSIYRSAVVAPAVRTRAAAQGPLVGPLYIHWPPRVPAIFAWTIARSAGKFASAMWMSWTSSGPGVEYGPTRSCPSWPTQDAVGVVVASRVRHSRSVTPGGAHRRCNFLFMAALVSQRAFLHEQIANPSGDPPLRPSRRRPAHRPRSPVLPEDGG